MASGTGDPSIVDPGALYDCGKVSPFNCYFEGLSETIDPKTGALIVRQKDLALPGRNGFDLVIERVYNSQQAAAGKPVVDVRAKWRVRRGSEQHWSEYSGAFVEHGQTYRHRFAGSISWQGQRVVNGTIRAWFSGTVYKMLWKPDSWS